MGLCHHVSKSRELTILHINTFSMVEVLMHANICGLTLTPGATALVKSFVSTFFNMPGKIGKRLKERNKSPT